MRRFQGVVGGALVVALFLLVFRAASPSGTDVRSSADIQAGLGSGMISGLMAALEGQVQQNLGDGEYLFLPNRRSIWVVNTTTGRFANFNFRDDQAKTILISRIVTLNQRDFPPDETHSPCPGCSRPRAPQR